MKVTKNDRATRFWLIRHAPVAGARAQVINGRVDVPCDLSDRTATARLAGALPADAAWFTSTLSRTIETARAVAGDPVVTPEAIDDLCEQAFGRWEGRRWAELDPTGNAEAARFWSDPGRQAPPGGESFADMSARVAAVLEDLLARHTGGDVVVVAHAGTVRAALDLAIAKGPGVGLGFKIDPLSLTRLDAIDRPGEPVQWVIRWVNRTFSEPAP